MLHRLAELDAHGSRRLTRISTYERIFATLTAFMNADLSAFYFDIRKDALYCDPISSRDGKAALTVIDALFRARDDLARADAAFSRAEEAWLARYPSSMARSISNCFRTSRRLARRRRWPRNGARSAIVRRVVTGALEIERADKRIGSSLEAAPFVYVSDRRTVCRAG